LADFKANAWYPNTKKGDPKYDKTVRDFLTDIEANTTYVYRAVIVMWYAAFETFLEDRLKKYFKRPRNWGPFTETLCCPQLIASPSPLPLSKVVRGDLCRKVRNCFTHRISNLPQSVKDQVVRDWKREIIDDLKKRFWTETPKEILTETQKEKIVNDAIQYVIGGVEARLARFPHDKKPDQRWYFYALFSFTNLSELAKGINGALAAYDQYNKVSC
jgi:hypothetical protein